MAYKLEAIKPTHRPGENPAYYFTVSNRNKQGIQSRKFGQNRTALLLRRKVGALTNNATEARLAVRCIPKAWGHLLLLLLWTASHLIRWRKARPPLGPLCLLSYTSLIPETPSFIEVACFHVRGGSTAAEQLCRQH